MDAILDGGWGGIKRQDLRDPLGLCPTLVLLMCCRSLGDRSRAHWQHHPLSDYEALQVILDSARSNQDL